MFQKRFSIVGQVWSQWLLIESTMMISSIFFYFSWKALGKAFFPSVRHGSVWHLTAYFLGWRHCISDYIQWRNRYTWTNHSTPSLVVSCEVPLLLVTKFRSINFSCVWLGQDSCRLCKVESFIFIWGCLALISRLGWRHRVSSSLFFNTRIVSYRDVKKKFSRGQIDIGEPRWPRLARPFKHYIYREKKHKN